MKQALLLIDHGSRREGSHVPLSEIASMMRGRFGLRIVHYAHMEFQEPTIQQGFDACVADGAEEVIVFPYFFSAGRHVATDIPNRVKLAAGRYPGVAFRITQPLGSHQKIGEVILERMAESEGGSATARTHLHAPDAVFRYCPRCGEALQPRRMKPDGPELQTCPRCSFVHYHDPKVAAGTLFTLDGGIVLVKRAIAPSYGKWVFPCGYVDKGERVDAAAVRETREEVNLDVKIDRLLNVYSYDDSAVVVIAYAAHVVGGELQAKDEALDAQVFPTSRIPWSDLAFRSAHDAIKDYIAHCL